MRDQLWLPEVAPHLGEPPALCPPVIKYAGGKSWLVPLVLPRLHAHLVTTSGTYIEPFCGGLAMGLGIGWPRSVLSDASTDLINLYRALGTDPDQVVDELDVLRARVTEADYYEIRREVWPEHRAERSQFAWAARVVYLNKTSFNGLWRVNRKGQYNVPWGKKERPELPSRVHLVRAGSLLGQTDLRCVDFATVLESLLAEVEAGQLAAASLAVLVDPPYGASVPEAWNGGARARKQTDCFVGYSVGGFSWEQQTMLGDLCVALARRGALVMATNAWAEEILALYPGFQHFRVGVRHSVGAKADRRGVRSEMLAVDDAHAHIVEMTDVRIAKPRGGLVHA